MIKQVALLKAKAGMSRGDFIKRYEEGHAPLASRLLPFFADYRRSFVRPESMVAVEHVGGAAPPPPFDVVTELWFENQAAVDRMGNAMTDPGVAQRIADDEADLFDRSKILMFAADECVTPADRLGPRPAGHGPRPDIKMICLLKKKPGLSRDAFINYYETRHAQLALEILRHDGRPVFAEYRRTFPLSPHSHQLPHVDTPPVELGFDCLTEIYFWTDASYQSFRDLCKDPKIGDALAIDEGNLFTREAITMFLADEFISPKAA